MIINREERIKHLGFDDKWFVIIGIVLLSLSTIYVFNFGIAHLTTIELIITFVASLIFSTSDWLINRLILIRLRKSYPSIKDSVQRVILLFIGTFLTVISVDFIGVNLISLFTEHVYYDFQERVRSLVVVVFLTIMIMAIYEAIYFFVLLKKSVREEERAKQATIQAELDTLRNQVQPHFLFNSLNTLRDIIDQNPKEDAKHFVDRLSEIYRFLLESGNKNLIALKEELKFAKAYMHIQSERFGENLKVYWDVPLQEDKLIASMSLQLLLENAIKHNIVSRSMPLEISVTIANDCIVVTNNIQRKSTQLPSTKMGLKNIKKRYAAITDRSVAIVNDGHQFSIAIPLLNVSTHKEEL